MFTCRGVLVAVLFGFSLLSCGPPRHPWEPPVNPAVSSLRAVHLEGKSFFNPWARLPSTKIIDAMRWYLSFGWVGRRKAEPPAFVANDGSNLAGVEHSATVTWVGHATFAVHDESDVFLTDPHFSQRAGLQRRTRPPGLPLSSIPPDAFAVISHNHNDHLDEDTVTHSPTTLQWYVPLGVGDWFRARGRQVEELDWWQSANRGRWKITCLPAQHWSARLDAWPNHTLWCSWLIESAQRKYYFSGDSGYFHGFREFGKEFPNIDVAMLGIGAFEPRWMMRYQHMSPDEAYQAFQDLGARFMLPMHWGTFDQSNEPFDEAPLALARAVQAQHHSDDPRVHVMAIGETWHVPE